MPKDCNLLILKFQIKLINRNKEFFISCENKNITLYVNYLI